MNKSFERKYSLNIARLKDGKSQESYLLDDDFFSYFENSLVKSGEVKVQLDLFRTDSHIEAKFQLNGAVKLECDRCLEEYEQPVDAAYIIFYSYDENIGKENHEVIQISRTQAQVILIRELYDFTQLAVPFRKVPDKSVHLCPPSVLAMLGLDEEGEETLIEEEDDVIDPRWESLKKLKNQ